MSHREKEKIFTMGLTPTEYTYSLPEPTKNVVWKKYPKSNTADESENTCQVGKEDITWTRCSFDTKHEYATNYTIYEHHLLKRHNEDIIVGMIWRLPRRDDYNYSRTTTIDDEIKQELVAMGFTIDELPKFYSPDDPINE